MTSTYPTQTIQTDRNGFIYYGPKMLKDAISMASDLSPSETRYLADRIRNAGYPGVAARLLTHYGLTR